MPQKEHSKKLFFKKSRILLTGLVLFFLFSVFFLPSSYMQSYMQEKMERLLNDRLGRSILIGGPVHIGWDWSTPHIQAEKIRIANMAGSKEPYMLDIEKIDFTLRLWKLLTGRLEIRDMDVFRPQIFLEKRTAKIKNWDFNTFSGATIAKKVLIPETESKFPLIGTLRVSEGKVSYKDSPRNLAMVLNLDTVKQKGLSPEGSFVLKGDGTMEGQKFRINAAGGSLELLQNTRKGFPLVFEITMGRSVFSLDGTFTDPAQLRGLNATLHLGGRNLADLFYLMHIPFPPTPSYKLKGQLKKDDDYWTFNKFSGKIGHSDLSGNVVYNAKGERPLLSGDLFSTRLDVADLGGLIGLSPAAAPKGTTKRETVLPDVPLDLKRLRAGDMELNLKAKKLNAPGWPLSDMQTHISLKTGLLELKPLQFGAADGLVDGFLKLDGRRDMPQVKMDLDLKKLSLKRFFPGATYDDFSQGFFNGHIQLLGPGHSVAQALGNSNGRIVFTVAGGKINKALIESANPNIAKLILLPGKNKTTSIRCGIGDFKVADGQLKSQIFMLDTADIKLEGKANINLKRETIDASFHAYPKSLSLLSMQPKILMTGKMSSPSIKLDPLSMGTRVLSATLLTGLAPFAAILPFLEPGSGDKNVACDQLISQMRN